MSINGVLLKLYVLYNNWNSESIKPLITKHSVHIFSSHTDFYVYIVLLLLLWVGVISIQIYQMDYIYLPQASLTHVVTPCEQEHMLQLSTVSINVEPSGTIVPDTLQAEISIYWGWCNPPDIVYTAELKTVEGQDLILMFFAERSDITFAGYHWLQICITVHLPFLHTYDVL